MQYMWSFTCRLQLFLGPAVQSCRNCTPLLVLRHVSVGRTQRSGLEIAVKPKDNLFTITLCTVQTKSTT